MQAILMVSTLFIAMGTLVIILAYRELKTVHKAVNSNMESAIAEIRALHERVAGLVAELDAEKRKP